MNDPKTIKGYISLIKQIEKIDLTNLKGYDKLSITDKESLSFLSGDISNAINEINKDGTKIT